MFVDVIDLTLHSFTQARLGDCRLHVTLECLDELDVSRNCRNLFQCLVPTLVMHGDADRIVRVTAATHTVTTVPSAKLLVYDDVGHAVQIDAPQRFGRDLSEFVRATRRNRR